MSVLAIAATTQVPEGTPLAAPDTAAVVDALRDVREDTLVVATDAAGLEAARSAHLVLGGPYLGYVGLIAPPTLSFVAVAALRMLPQEALGLAPAVLEALQLHTRTAALVSSVSALERPRPSMALDVASRLPGAGFRVDWTAQTVSRGKELDLPDGVAAITTASERPVVEGAEARLNPARIALVSDGSFWGAKRWLEVTVMLQPLEHIVGGVLRPDVLAAAHRCDSCGRAVLGPSCPFCQIPVEPGTSSLTTGGHV